MGWNLQTRSRNRDYRFLGTSPERWWTQWSRDTSFERPTLLVEGGEQGWRLLASGIPSARRDGHRTRIRHTLVGFGAPGEGVEQVLGLVSTWLEDSARHFAGESTPDSRGDLSRALDRHLPEELIESWFETKISAEELQRDVGRACERVLGELSPEPRPSAMAEHESWFGGAQSASCRAAFVAQVGALVRGEAEGGAYLLNLIEHPAELGAPLDRSKVALLFDLPAGQADSPRSWQRAEQGASKKKRARRSAAEPPPAESGRKSSASPPDSRRPLGPTDRRDSGDSGRSGADGAAGLDTDGQTDSLVGDVKDLWGRRGEVFRLMHALQEQRELLPNREALEKRLDETFEKTYEKIKDAAHDAGFDEAVTEARDLLGELGDATLRRDFGNDLDRMLSILRQDRRSAAETSGQEHEVVQDSVLESRDATSALEALADDGGGQDESARTRYLLGRRGRRTPRGVLKRNLRRSRFRRGSCS